jgi:DNA replication and repair protein RecF
MFLSKISLQNFRNYQGKVFDFDQDTTLVVGPNASGKTNLLEAIYLLATGRSFRAEVEAEMISYGEEMARVKCQINTNNQMSTNATNATNKFQISNKQMTNEETELEIILTIGEVAGRKVAKKICKVNGVNKRMVDFVGNLRAVYFGPEDLQLVTDSPSLRRRYLDMVLSQVDREYQRAVLSYEKGLRQRNKILEEFQSFRVSEFQNEEIRRRLYFWDQLLVKEGNYISQKRTEFVDFVNEEGKEGGDGNLGEFGLEYVGSVISPAGLVEGFAKELILGQTLVGPHRDDFRFEGKEGRKGRDLSLYGSRGEQRLAVLWLKLGELEFVAQKTQGRPVLLLDDIFSELDEENIRLISQIGLIGRQQTILTTTERRPMGEVGDLGKVGEIKV